MSKWIPTLTFPHRLLFEVDPDLAIILSHGLDAMEC